MLCVVLFHVVLQINSILNVRSTSPNVCPHNKYKWVLFSGKSRREKIAFLRSPVPPPWSSPRDDLPPPPESVRTAFVKRSYTDDGLPIFLTHGASRARFARRSSATMYLQFFLESFRREKDLIVQFWIRHDRWIKALTIHFYWVSLYLKWNIHKFQREDDLFTAVYCLIFKFVALSHWYLWIFFQVEANPVQMRCQYFYSAVIVNSKLDSGLAPRAVIGYLSGQDGAILPIRSRWLDIGLVLFCKFMDRDEVEVHKHAKKELGQYPAILTSHLVNNPYIILQLTISI